MNHNKDEKVIFSLSLFGVGLSLSNKEAFKFHNIWLFAWVVFAGIFFMGCETNPVIDENVKNPAPVIEEAVKDTKKSAEIVREGTAETIEKAKEIKKSAGEIIDKVSEETKPVIKPEVDKIDENSDAIIVLQKEMQKVTAILEKTAAQLASAQNDILTITAQKTELLKENQEVKEQLQKAQRDAATQRNAYLTWLTIGGIIMLAICIAAAARGETKAIWGAITAAVVIVASLGVSYYSAELAIWGAVGLVAAIGIAIFMAYRNHVQDKALNEVVHTLEVAKQDMDEEVKHTVFGHKAKPGLAFSIQSPSTEKIVQRKRKMKKDAWTSTLGDK